MCCLHSAEISATYLSNPRLITTKDFDPSPLKESICTSMPYRPWCNETFPSWMGPKMVVSLQYTFYFGFKVITHGGNSRHVVVISCCSIFFKKKKLVGLERCVPLPHISRILLRDTLAFHINASLCWSILLRPNPLSPKKPTASNQPPQLPKPPTPPPPKPPQTNTLQTNPLQPSLHPPKPTSTLLSLPPPLLLTCLIW